MKSYSKLIFFLTVAMIFSLHKPGICRAHGITVDEDLSRAAGNSRVYQGKTYYFCSPECREAFTKEAHRFLQPSPVKNNQQISLTNTGEGTGKHNTSETHAASRSMEEMDKSKSKEEMTMPKPSGQVVIPKSNTPSNLKGPLPPEQTGSKPGMPMPMIPKNTSSPSPFMGGSPPATNKGALPPAFVPPSKPGTKGNTPFPGIPNQTKGGNAFPAGNPPQIKSKEMLFPKGMAPSDSKPGTVSPPIPKATTPPKGPSPFPMPVPDKKTGSISPPLPGVPSESKNEGLPSQEPRTH